MADAEPAELFLIAQGVHRSVAAREASLHGVLSQIEVDGVKIGLRVIPLDRLVSPKATVGRWDRDRDFFGLVALMRTAPGRATLDPVIVSPVPASVARRFTRLLDVAVIEEPEED